MRNVSFPSRRARTSCSVLALATVLVVGASPAAAQSFLGNGTVTSGTGTITTGSSTTNISVTTSQTVIDWVPTENAIGGGTINFQPAGTTANFSGPATYAVLNRINPADSSRAIGLNGTIQTVAAGAGGGGNGSIYFYSPGGFVIGADARINVGSLVLSASPITVTAGSFISGFGTTNTVVFGSATQAGAAISTNALSQITASGGDAYVAMVAPRVNHGGSINVSGSAALVAADAATINFSPDGLFDIQVTSGTNNLGALTNSGTITGPASTGAADIHRAYLVAVPKNDAMTMLLTAGSSLGFAIAGAADVVGNTVVLSAGYDVVDGVISTSRSALGGTGVSALTVYDSNFTSQVNASATGLGLFAADTATASMAAGLTLRSVDGQLNAFNSGIHQVVGSVILDSNNLGVGTGQTGGRSSAYAAFGGTINIGGDLTIRSQGIGTAGVSGTGGLSTIGADLGGTVSIGGMLRLNADGIGGSGASGLGGTVDVVAGTNSSLSAGSLNMSADGFGGDDAGSGAGNGTGGSARLLATGTEASISIANIVVTGNQNQRDFISVEGYGGQTNGGGSGIGGTGQGGTLLIRGEGGGTLALPNIVDSIGVRILARGYGGDASANETTGGLGAAGTLNLQLDNASLTAGPVILSAAGIGGYSVGVGNINGGSGVGGTRAISAVNGSTLSIGLPGGIAGGTGGNGSGTGVGGNATGGTASLLVDNSTVSFTSRSFIIAQNLGGNGAIGGNASGGTGTITVRNGGIVNVANDPTSSDDLTIGSYAYGGVGSGAQGGTATAGNGSMDLQGGTINLTGNMAVGAEARGGDATGSGIGGNATGGFVNAFATGANNAIIGSGTAKFSTDAFGGFSLTGTGGNATGGSTNVGTNNGATLAIASSAVVSASGFGGGGGTVGGGGFGGTARISAASGSSLTIGGITQIDANGVGGGDGESNGNGGLGDGGLAAIYSAGGTITFNDDVTVSASATGGSASNGSGGAALGGTARLGTDSGTIVVNGDLSLTGSATGGTGSTGGNATALVSPGANEASPVAVALYAGTGGSVTVSGQTALDGRATGGTGFNGNGGNATGGEADVVVAVGGISLDSLAIDVTARGGNGGNGGNGGSGQGGAVDVAFGLDNALINGTITLGSATINADGYGGNGGAGIDDNFGGAGGAGGAGAGGSIAFVGSAAGGTLNSGDAILTARGIGGHGAAGGNGDSGTGGAGGSGGAGTGGSMQTGSISQSGALGSGGGVALADLSINTNAVGGNGGNGGSGGGGNGAGGNGGDAAGGSANFLIRGVLGTADVVTLTANAAGGNGGTGSTFGDGGDARTGVIFVESKDRFDVPAQRGTLTANSIVGNAIATGGSGATPGISTVLDGSYFRVLNGDATVGSVSITLSGNLVNSTLGPSFVSIIDGAATIIGSFSFVTGGNLSLFANNGDMHIGNLTLSAGNFVFDPVSDPPSDRGTYFADSATITTGNNFVTSADLVIGSSLVINAPGLINAHNFEIDGDLDLIAQSGGITANNLDVTGAIDLDAFGAINLNIVEADFFYADAGSSFTSSDITSDSYIRIFAGDDVTLGEVVAGPATDIDSNKAIRIITDGSVLAGNILSAGGIDITALGSVTGGNVTTGDGLFTDAVGTILYGNISAGLINPQPPSEPFSVGLASGASISVGNVDASLGIAFVTRGTLTTGYLTTTGDVIGLVNGNISIGNIRADGRVLLAGYAMYTDAGGTIPTGDGFNPEDIFAATLVPTNGSITVGTVLAGSFQAAAGTSLTTGLIDTDSEIEMDAGGAITTGNLSAGDFVLANGGSITTGNIDANSVGITSTGGDITIGTVVAFGDVELDSFDDIVTGDITAGSIDLAAGDAITTGNLTTQQPLVLNFGDGEITTLLYPGASITLQSGGDIATGDIDSIDGVYADAGGSIATGTIDAIDFVELYAVGGIGTGNIAAGQYLWVDSGGSQSLGNLNAGWDIDLEAGGNVTFGNALAGTEFDFEVSGNVSGGTIVAGATIEGEAGGSITLGNLTAGFDPDDYVDDDIFSVGIVAEGSIIVGNVQGADAVGFGTLGSLTTGNLTGGGLVMTLVGGNTTTGSITTTGEFGQVYMAHASMCETGGGCGQDGDFDPNIVLALAPDPTGGSILINGPVTTGQFRAAAGTTLTINGNISADSSVALSSGGAMLIESVDAGSSIGLRLDASITGDNLTAGTSVLVEANDAISLGNILAGTGISVLDVGPGSAVEIFTHGSIVTGNITTDGYVGLYAEVDVTVGAIVAGHDVIALVGDDASFGAITTPERFFLGGYAMTELVGGGENFNPEGVFDIEDPIATDGSALFAGSSSAATFEAYVGDDTTLASLDTDYFATIDTGGLFTLTGALDGYSLIISNDIAIGTNASINNGYLSLISRNPGQTLIGDGLDALGQGYRLSDAGVDRIHTAFSVAADTSYGAAAKMIIGDLSVIVPGASEDEYGYEFETINRDSDDPSVGSIKIVGDVVFTGVGAGDEVSFDTNLFELDAATGSISLFSEGTTLGGELGIYAPRIWVASGDILTKLEANSTYSGYITELNAPAAVQRPEGVLRAASFDFDSDEETGRSFLVQNTGTREAPAGFVLNESGLDDDGGDEGSEAPPGSIDLVINGQIITGTGTLTGIAARDRLVTNIGTTEFTAGSTVNGCPLVGACTSPPPPKVDTPTDSNIQLTDNGGLGDGLFGNEGDIDDGESGDGESRSSPIAPPNPLFDSRPLTQSADVDDPVSGAGNPSLFGDTSDEDVEVEDCDSSTDASCKAGTKGDGK